MLIFAEISQLHLDIAIKLAVQRNCCCAPRDLCRNFHAAVIIPTILSLLQKEQFYLKKLLFVILIEVTKRLVTPILSLYINLKF